MKSSAVLTTCSMPLPGQVGACFDELLISAAKTVIMQ